MPRNDAQFNLERRALIAAGATGFLGLAGAAALSQTAEAAAPGKTGPGAGADVRPEDFGAVGDGRHDDTLAWQAAIATARVVAPRPGATYIIGASLQPHPKQPLLIRGAGIHGNAASTLKAAPGFRGYLLKPSGSYDIRGIRLAGNGREGCHLIGSDEVGGAGFAILDTVMLQSADTFVNFGSAWEHPLGLSYDRIYGQHFRTAGIIVGGVEGAARSGESAWRFGLIVMTNGGGDGGGRVPAQGVEVRRNFAAGSDLVTWSGAGAGEAAPLFGWVVLRSKDGKTGWAVPPNWGDVLCRDTRFVASKEPGEDWTYAVMRQTVGVCLHRGKAVAAGVIQAEYCGIGVLLISIAGFDIQTIYSESRDRAPNPFPNLAAVMVKGTSYGSIGATWVESIGYGVITDERANVDVRALHGNALRWALRASTAANDKGASAMQTGSRGIPAPYRQLARQPK